MNGLDDQGLKEFARLRECLPDYVKLKHFSKDELFKVLEQKAIRSGTDQALILLLAECSYVVGYLDGIRTSVKGMN